MSDTKWPNFWRYELACKHCGQLKMDESFMDKIQEMRTKLGFAFPVSSGYRCPEHNVNVSKSGMQGPHTWGRAMDIYCDQPDFNLYEFWRMAYATSMTGHGHGEPKGFVHIDNLTGGDHPRFHVRPNAWLYI